MYKSLKKYILYKFYIVSFKNLFLYVRRADAYKN